MRACGLLAAVGLLVMAATATGQVSSPLTTLNNAAAGPTRKPAEDTGKTKLKAARSALAQGDFTTAEDLAREAAAEGGTYGPRDDSPARVLEDVARARKDPHALLTAARFLFKHGQFDQAEQCAEVAQKNASTFTFPVWGDTPARLKRDVQAARAKQAKEKQAESKTPKEKNQTGSTTKTTSGKTEKKETTAARPADWTDDKSSPEPKKKESSGPFAGMRNLFGGKSEKKTEQTAEKKPAAEKKTETQKVDSREPTAGTRKPSSSDTDEARKLVASGRRALADGQLEKAAGYAEQARKLKPNLQWYEDNPERLTRAITDAAARQGKKLPSETDAVVRTGDQGKPNGKTETKSDEVQATDAAPARSQAEAVALLREGRKQLAAGKLAEAKITVQRVRDFHEGKYGLFDDSPDKLLGDISKARAKKDREQSIRVLAEGRKALAEEDYDRAEQLAFQAEQLHGPYSIWDMGDRPNKLLDDVGVARQKKQSGAALAKRGGQPKKEQKVVVAENAPEKQRARQLLAEAKVLQSKGQLLEAKQKVAEAETIKVTFKVDEPSPASVQMDLAAQAKQKSDTLLRQAVELAAYGQGAPAENYKQAGLMLVQARDLAVAFDLDVRPIDERGRWLMSLETKINAPVQQATGPNLAPPAGPAVAQAEGDPGVDMESRRHGLELLEKSRLEMRKGNRSMARTMAEEAYQGPFGVKKLAEARLRELDIEDHNQKMLEVRRTFDAGVASFNRRDFFQAHEILAGVALRFLDEPRQARLREIMASPEMSSTEFLSGKDNLGSATPPARMRVTDRNEGPKVADATPPTPAQDPLAGKVTISDDFESDILKTTRHMQSVQKSALRAEAMEVMRKANEVNARGDAEGAVAMLQDFIRKLPESSLDADTIAMIRRPIDSRIQKYQLMTAQKDIDRQTAGLKRNPNEIILNKVLADQNKQKNVAQLMKQFTEYYKAGKYKEAEMYARMVIELDPDNPVATAAVTVARTQGRLTEDKKRKANTEEFVNHFLNVEGPDMGPIADVKNPSVINKDRNAIGRKRQDLSHINLGESRKSSTVREIEAKLDLPVTLNWQDVPLRDVIEDLRKTQSINIVPDTSALKQENISLERLVTISLDKVSLKSALNLVLRQVDLTWVIRDEVLQVTTPANAKGKLVQRVYQVADLVIPVENHNTPDILDFTKQWERLNAVNAPLRGAPAPTPTPGNVPGGLSVGTPMGSQAADGGFASSPGSGNMQVQTPTHGGPANAMPQQLINLIQNSVQPDSWSSLQGPGTIDYFPLGMTLVINQTPDIQEQIADLLQQLRRLQDLEVAIEIRLISLSDSFFERMGVNFDLKIKTDRETRPYEPTLIRGLTTGQFKPNGFVQDFSPSRFIAGITPAKTFTSDLDIPLTPSSFGLATPPFGLSVPFTANTTGGMSFGLAFLSDLQVYFFLEAAQGDQRFNVMQSPKIMAFNGQSVSLSAGYSQTFVSGVQISQQGTPGGPLFLPNASVQTFNTTINVQPVVTGDRRFVRINVGLGLNNPIAEVPVFPIVVTAQPFIEGVGSVGNPTILTQFIQQPASNFLQVQTTAVVPDGGTVLLGGLKRLAEGRNEFGPPILSKIPYLNRLVKNVGYGRETENILMMITPRIVINEEEEIIQTGVISNPALIQQ